MPRYAAGVVKHTNPCGAAVADDPIEAYRKAYLGDPMAAMGGVLAVNFPVTVDVADAVLASLQRWGKSAGAGAFFVEVWVAPAFDADAIHGGGFATVRGIFPHSSALLNGTPVIEHCSTQGSRFSVRDRRHALTVMKIARIAGGYAV